MRRTSLLVCLLLVLAGCTTMPTDGPSDGTTEASTETTETPMATTGTPTGTPDTSTKELRTRTLPEKPERLTRGSVSQYVILRESAVLYNREMRRGSWDTVGAACGTESVTQVDNAWRVELSCTVTTEGNDENANATSVGDQRLTVTYLVNESATVRHEQ